MIGLSFKVAKVLSVFHVCSLILNYRRRTYRFCVLHVVESSRKLDHENGGSTLLRKVGKLYLPLDTAYHSG